MKSGDVIEFDAGDQFLLGVITRDLGQKYVLVTEEGDEMRATDDEITHELGTRIDPDRGTDGIVDRLETYRNEIDATADEVDVGFLWEFVGSDVVTAAELSELFFESSETAEVLGVQQKLRENDLYFKGRNEGFEPRSENQVEEMRRQLEAERRERERRQKFVEGIVEILEADEGERAELADEKMADQAFRQFANTLQEYAIYDQGYGERDEALELMSAIEEELGRELRGQYGPKAFWLFVEMGIWSEHENLWIHRYNLGGEADEEVVEAIEAIEQEGWEPESWRRDLTDLRCFSIDDPSTRDIDDALSCRRLPDGGWQVGIHIADPSAHVEAGDPLDRHARKRGTSIYLPWTTIPMFPPRMSEEIASLVAGKTRPAISVLIEFDEDLERVDHEIVPSALQVDHRLTYERADALLEGEGDDEQLAEALQKLGQLGDECRRRRKEAGAISVDLPDPDVRVEWNDEGEPEVACGVKSREAPSDEIVSEFMIQANTLLGKFCREKDIPVIYRTQESPDQEVLDEEVRDVPEGIPRQFAIIYKLKPGNLTTEPGYHFGLGVSTYTQATSPIRRYADLICQRQIKAYLADEELPHDEDEMVDLLGRVETASREAGRTQSETQQYWILEYLRRKGDEPLEATIVEHKNNDGTHAAVWLEEVAQKFNCNFRKTVPVGEMAEVVVDHVNPRRDQISLKGA
jgi:exoribonuclease-2